MLLWFNWMFYYSRIGGNRRNLTGKRSIMGRYYCNVQIAKKTSTVKRCWPTTKNIATIVLAWNVESHLKAGFSWRGTKRHTTRIKCVKHAGKSLEYCNHCNDICRATRIVLLHVMFVLSPLHLNNSSKFWTPISLKFNGETKRAVCIFFVRDSY